MEDLDLKPGDVALVEYEGEALMHERLLLRRAAPDTFEAVMKEDPVVGDKKYLFWILTPTGDIYPEELHVPPLVGLAISDDDEGRKPGSMRPRGRRLAEIFGFEERRGPGALEPKAVVEAMLAAEHEDTKVVKRLHPPTGAAQRRPRGGRSIPVQDAPGGADGV